MTEKQNIFKLIIGIVVLVAALNFGIILFLYPSSHIAQTGHINPSPTVAAKVQTATYTYRGEEGKDALTLMKEKTSVLQNPSGLVTSINAVAANEKKHEYWAFYVNGKYASVGPKDYVTKATDTIVWRIEKY